MNATIGVNLDAFDAMVPTIVSALRPDVPGAFQDGMREALVLCMTWEQDPRFSTYMTHGGDWADHALSTKVRKARELGLHVSAAEAAEMEFMLLFVSGHLFNSLTGGAIDNEFIFTETTAGCFSVTSYGGYLQEGTPKMPARPFVVEPPPDVLAEAGQHIAAGATAQLAEVLA